jgi:hypothetical protein
MNFIFAVCGLLFDILGAGFLWNDVCALVLVLLLSGLGVKVRALTLSELLACVGLVFPKGDHARAVGFNFPFSVIAPQPTMMRLATVHDGRKLNRHIDDSRSCRRTRKSW